MTNSTRSLNQVDVGSRSEVCMEMRTKRAGKGTRENKECSVVMHVHRDFTSISHATDPLAANFSCLIRCDLTTPKSFSKMR